MMTARQCTLWVAVAALIPVFARAQSSAPASGGPPPQARTTTRTDASAARPVGGGLPSVVVPKVRGLGLHKSTVAQSSPSRTAAPRPSALATTAHPLGMSQSPAVPRPLAPTAGLAADRGGAASPGSDRIAKAVRPAHFLPSAGLVPSTIRRRTPNTVSLSGTSLSARSKGGTVALDGASVHQQVSR